jgi:hypothetical protein
MNEALRELTRRADIKGYRLVLATVMERGDGVLAGGLAVVERRECPFEARPYATLRWAVGDDGQATSTRATTTSTAQTPSPTTTRGRGGRRS